MEKCIFASKLNFYLAGFGTVAYGAVLLSNMAVVNTLGGESSGLGITSAAIRAKSVKIKGMRS